MYSMFFVKYNRNLKPKFAGHWNTDGHGHVTVTTETLGLIPKSTSVPLLRYFL